MQVAILLPTPFDIGWLCRARVLALAFLEDSALLGQSIERVAIGLPCLDAMQYEAYESELCRGDERITVRRLAWERVPSDAALRMYENVVADLANVDEVAIPRDWTWNFTDCDLWIVLADAGLGAILPLRPCVYYCRGLTARYLPHAFGDKLDDPYWRRQTDAFRMWRNANSVIAVDPATIDDLNAYAGIRRNRLYQVPYFLRPGGAAEVMVVRPTERATLLWMTDFSQADEVENAMQALQGYARQGGRLSVLVVHEPNATEAAAKPIVEALRGFPVDFATVSTDAQLEAVVSRAQVVWSSSLHSGEPDLLVRAIRHRKPYVGYDYPQVRRVLATFGGTAYLYQRSDPVSIFTALQEAEESNVLARRSALSDVEMSGTRALAFDALQVPQSPDVAGVDA